MQIKSIFFCLFHPQHGPQIVAQVPDNCINDEDFHSIQNYLIPREELQQKLITVKAFGHKILGCPVHIKNDIYSRNAFLFNVCFVFDPNTNTTCYERVLKKLVQYLTVLEMESKYLSSISDNLQKQPLLSHKEFYASLGEVLQQVLNKINSCGSCAIPIDEANTIHLKLVPTYDVPMHIGDHDVPLLTFELEDYHFYQWDLATQQVIPIIDGFKHVAQIAAEAGKDVQLVKTLIENLLYFKLVKIIPIFQYSNIYMVTSDIQKLYQSNDLQCQCLEYVRLFNKPLPHFDDVLRVYSCFTHGTMTTVERVCTRLHPHNELAIDIRKLIQFGVVNGFIRRMHKYPVQISPPTTTDPFLRYCDGMHSYDEICCTLGISHNELDAKVEENYSVMICWK